MKGSLSHGLWYKRCNEFILSGFVDAYWAGDTQDRLSTSGYCISSGSTVISWCSKKHDVVALSSTKVEYVIATMASR